MKTISELALELGVSKQRVYRHIKRCALDVHRDAGVIRLDDAVENAVRQAFIAETLVQGDVGDVHHDARHDAASDAALMQSLRDMIDVLKAELAASKEELAEKNAQIDKLMELQRNQQVLFREEQVQRKPKLGFFRRLFLPKGAEGDAPET